ncbi:SUMF1/EgtB/PvdO family nonheme iron enzyme [Nocardia arizonensis]|uniref:SUMF1/EgtB/PvdO family nonheme iron enzyme n=1 Tax=Nocardia arizonensis TaxID=1141647 RepID=UPI00138F9BA8|nr:SUMF1/EgtB/PvdO family nonheme iron enzyme [Nocardia arizonensis]
MADLEPGLSLDVQRWLRPHLITDDQRVVALTHLLSQWPGRTDLRWGAPAGAFTAELVDLLPNEMLIEVLSAVGAGLGVEQHRAAEELCARVDATTAAARHGSLPALRIKMAPARRADVGGSVLFRAADPAEPETTLSIEAIRAAWRGLIVLVTDFPLDAEQSLAALAEADGPTLWIAGEDLLSPDPPPRFANVDDGRRLADSPPGSLLVDFSAVRPEWAEDEPGRAAETLRVLLAWAEAKGHRVALGVPRYVLSLLGPDSPHRWYGQVYRAAELFSSRYAHRAEHCEQLLGAPLPLREILFPLLSANSVCLPRQVAELLARGSRRRPRTEPDEIALALRLARGLTAYGFYEIAYRLEVHCRTRSIRTGAISLAVDLLPAPGSPEKDRVVGFVSSTSELPASVRRAALTGPTGVGKSIALGDIENRWSIPRNGELDEWIVPYLPLYVSLSGASSPRRRIDEHIAGDGFRWFAYGEERFELGCHTLIGRLGSLEAMRRLFGSPVLLLLDDADEVSVDAAGDLGLDTRSKHDMGLLLASRGNRLGHALRLKEARIRELDEERVSLLVQRQRGDPSLIGLLGAHGRAITRHLRNPRLLTLLCELELTGDDLADANLEMIIERFVTRRSTENGSARAAGEHPERLTRWLADVAYELLTAPGRIRRATPEERALVADVRGRGLLREHADRDHIEFGFETLADYFAARRLAADIGRRGVNSVVEPHIRQIVADSPTRWRDVCRILAALLREQDAHRFIELLARHDLRLAHECAVELPAERGRIGADTAALLVRRIVADRDTDDRVEDARALGRHDPRIDVDAPLFGLVEVPASERQGPYRIGKYPVTTMEFARFVADGGYRTPAWWSRAGWTWIQKHHIAFPRYWHNHVISRPNHPVTGVNFFEAGAYCAWLTSRHRNLVFRLPSTLEWDRAAHGDERVLRLVLDIASGASGPEVGQPAGRGRRGRSRETHGNVPPAVVDDFAMAGELRGDMDRVRQVTSIIEEYLVPHQEQLRYEVPAPVGVFAANGLGIHDLFGGVWEWCNTAIAQVSQTERLYEDLSHNPSIANGVAVAIKGGGSPSGAYNPIWLLIGGWFDPLVRSHRLGFRVTCHPEIAGASTRTR